MLSAKFTRVHGMKNEKWTTREKSLQYRAILKLHGSRKHHVKFRRNSFSGHSPARDKKLQATNALKFKKKISRNLKELKSDIKEYRRIVSDVETGDKRLLRAVVQSEKDFQSLLQNADPLEAYTVIFQDYNLKRKQLDKLTYLKDRKINLYCELRLKVKELTCQLGHKMELTPLEEKYQEREQRLLTRYQGALAKRHAAKSICDTYRQLLAILKKDAMYFDGVLNALREDQRDQCRVIYKTTMMGQLAAENLDDIRQTYKRMAKDVWINMKERERSLEIVKKKAEDVWEYAKSLVRTDSDVNIAKKSKKDTEIDKKLEKQIQHLEDIFKTMKESMLIRSYEELFVRLEDQMQQRERLSNLYKHHLREKDFALLKRNHAELVLSNLKHSMVSTTTQYKADKRKMLEKIKEQKQRQVNNREMLEIRGELAMKIRAALQNMASMLVCMKAPKPKGKEARKAKEKEQMEEKVTDKGKGKDKLTSVSVKSVKAPVDKQICDDPIETDGLGVLMQVSRKAAALFALTGFELEGEKGKRAKDMYETYVAEHWSKNKFSDLELETAGMYFEHEAVDSSVPTRAEIKTKSKQIVEAHSKADD